MKRIGKSCTTIAVTRGASVDRSVFISHADDNEMGDSRIIHVPAMEHPPGSRRPVYKYQVAYPRVVTRDLGPGYDTPGYPESEILGYIDQVDHTYAYFDGTYGIMNECQVCFGECTNAAQKYLASPEKEKRVFNTTTLSRVALERSRTVRDAIVLMGGLIDNHGYYDTGETMPVGDKEEAWVIEMCGVPDTEVKDGKTIRGLWVAKKVPDGEVFVAANEFRIRDIDPDDPQLKDHPNDRDNPDMIVSPYLFEVCEKLGWWDPMEGVLDWLKTVSWGEYCHPYYALRRVWRIFSRIAPSKGFSPWVEDGYTRAYPFSVKPDNKLDVKDVHSLFRDHYEGTEFDMTQGPAAGPFGNPNRYIDFSYDSKMTNLYDPLATIMGAWERPLSIFYCGFTYHCQARSGMPDPIGGRVWFGHASPYETCYVPFYIGMTKLPTAYSMGTPEKFDRDYAFWAFNFVSNYACIKYCYMKHDITAKQEELEDEQIDRLIKDWDAEALKIYEKDPAAAQKFLTDQCCNNANKIVEAWWKLSEYLIQKYADGYINNPRIGQEVPYPREWLLQVGYLAGPTSYEKPRGLRGVS